MSAPPDSPIRGAPAPPTSNVTEEQFLISVAGINPSGSGFTTFQSSIMGRDLQQFIVNESLLAYRPAIVSAARNMDDLTPVTNAKNYFAFTVLQNTIESYIQHGPEASKLTKLMVDMLEELLEGDELEPMKYCRFRHLGERHVLVVKAFVTIQRAPEVEDAYTQLTIKSKGGRRGVTFLEALYLQTLGRDFLSWMADMGMTLR